MFFARLHFRTHARNRRTNHSNEFTCTPTYRRKTRGLRLDRVSFHKTRDRGAATPLTRNGDEFPIADTFRYPPRQRYTRTKVRFKHSGGGNTIRPQDGLKKKTFPARELNRLHENTRTS